MESSDTAYDHTYGVTTCPMMHIILLRTRRSHAALVDGIYYANCRQHVDFDRLARFRLLVVLGEQHK